VVRVRVRAWREGRVRGRRRRRRGWVRWDMVFDEAWFGGGVVVCVWLGGSGVGGVVGKFREWGRYGMYKQSQRGCFFGRVVFWLMSSVLRLVE